MSGGGEVCNGHRASANKGVDGVATPADDLLGTKCFVAQSNPVTGKTDWALQAADYDYHQEIARSAYADMLHDTERNQKYYQALVKAVQLMRQQGKQVRALDIGTGTGLLSMMAATAGADSVTAIEAFDPMANCARQVMEANGLKNKINLIHARSTEVTVGEGKMMPQRANLLVSELFDTELIGEGVIPTISHAHDHLLEEDCYVLPRAANMYVQPVSSEFLQRWNHLHPPKVKGEAIRIPEEFLSCGGAPSLHDLQLDQLDQNLFTPLSDPVKVFRFDYTKREFMSKSGKSEVGVCAAAEGHVDALLMWWDIEMDPLGEIILTCAPRWAHPQGEQLPWRDHWMQAVFYPENQMHVGKGEQFNIISHHDEYSLWFETASKGQSVSEESPMLGDLHMAFSRQRLAMLSDPIRNQVFLTVLERHITSSSVCLCISDGSLLPIMAAKMGARKVVAVEGNALCARVMRRIVKENQLEDKVEVLQKTPWQITKEDLGELKVDIVLGEPSFQSQVLPWDAMTFWFAVSALRPLLPPDVLVLPKVMAVKAVAMRFKDLWKIRAPVGVCEGFDISIFDDMIKTASDAVDESLEPQPLWEYPGLAMSSPVEVLSLPFTAAPDTVSQTPVTVRLQCPQGGEVNGIALWCEFDFGEGSTISTGPRETPVTGQTVKWDFYSRQAVHLCQTPVQVTPGQNLTFDVRFKAEDGSIDFQLNSP